MKKRNSKIMRVDPDFADCIKDRAEKEKRTIVNTTRLYFEEMKRNRKKKDMVRGLEF